uniref:Uncharacterized protein n=1 Tax=Prymnesium polylepis TaxID=72548 RepID=A0A6T8ADL2_9EUKA|mmetsp:Transcript_15977/g.43369  ORF Transcript_15977/g.43369 Transcript_15977/m.43369 type:complete len:131 (+) Transcript_15977:63-455(+)
MGGTKFAHEIRPPLHEAVMKNDMKKVKRLIANGAKVTEKDHWGWPPLMLAIQHDHYDMVVYLVEEAGASIAAQDNDGWNVQEFVHQNSQDEEIIRYILMRGKTGKKTHVDEDTYKEIKGELPETNIFKAG